MSSKYSRWINVLIALFSSTLGIISYNFISLNYRLPTIVNFIIALLVVDFTVRALMHFIGASNPKKLDEPEKK